MSLDNRHKFALPYWARPGIVSFAKKDEGGGKDDDLNDDDEDDDDEDDDDEDDDPDADKDEATLRAELKAVRESLSKASGSSKSKRDKIKALTAELATAKAGKPAKSKSKDDDDEDAPDLDAVREQGKAEAQAEAKRVRIGDKAELALARANVVPDKLRKAVKLLDLDDLDLNDDGTLDGFDDQLDELKRDWPELFAKTRKRSSIAGEHDRGGDEKHAKRESVDQAQARQLTGRRR